MVWRTPVKPRAARSSMSAAAWRRIRLPKYDAPMGMVEESALVPRPGTLARVRASQGRRWQGRTTRRSGYYVEEEDAASGVPGRPEPAERCRSRHLAGDGTGDHAGREPPVDGQEEQHD